MSPIERRGNHPGRRKPGANGRDFRANSTPIPPEALRGRLDEGLARLSLDLDDVQRERLIDYLQLLAKWNAVYNLTSVRDPLRMVAAHLLDSLAALPPLLARLPQEARILDVGSGAGLPGIVWALVLDGDRLPRATIETVDAVDKKIAFQRQVQAQLGIPNLVCHHARVETLERPAFDVVTSRAYSTLNALVDGTRPLLADGGIWYALKGEVPTAELAALPGEVEPVVVERIEVPALDDAARCIVVLRPRDGHRTPPVAPDPAG